MLTALIEEWDTDLRSGDPLTFPGYADALAALPAESVRTGRCSRFVLIEGTYAAIGGSMGLVHGEKVVRAFDRAIELRLPVVVVTRSGGARMQEGMVSLVQLARTAAAVGRHQAAGLLSISIMRSPTTGGVLASYGSLTDLRVAERGALLGFAGPRVVAETTGEDVDGRSHTAERALEHGLIDGIVDGDEELDAWLGNALGIHGRPLLAPRMARPDGPLATPTGGSGAGEAMPGWDEVCAARRIGRPSGVHVAAASASSWVELGEGIDPALRTALGTMGGIRVVIVACDRYAGTGRPTPAGFRLAQRGIALAGRLGIPVVTFVDTPGADAGSEAENDGIAGEIARTFAALLAVPTPTVSVCVGEGGSGGALALAATDTFLIQAGAVFSVIGPEGAAAILRHDAAAAPEVAGMLALTSADQLRLGIVDGVIPDRLDATVEAIQVALIAAQDAGATGRRLDRFDAATETWLRRAPN